MNINGSHIRRNLLSLAVVFLLILAVPLLRPNTSKAHHGGFNSAYTVIPDLVSPNFSEGSTIYMRGRLFLASEISPSRCFDPPRGQPIGTWRAWGVVTDGGRMVLNQNLLFNGQGMLELQGVTGVPTNLPLSGELMTIIGGAGKGRVTEGMVGQASISPYCPNIISPFRYDSPFLIGLDFYEP